MRRAPFYVHRCHSNSYSGLTSDGSELCRTLCLCDVDLYVWSFGIATVDLPTVLYQNHCQPTYKDWSIGWSLALWVLKIVLVTLCFYLWFTLIHNNQESTPQARSASGICLTAKLVLLLLDVCLGDMDEQWWDHSSWQGVPPPLSMVGLSPTSIDPIMSITHSSVPHLCFPLLSSCLSPSGLFNT